jgi:hypothetical protein
MRGFHSVVPFAVCCVLCSSLTCSDSIPTFQTAFHIVGVTSSSGNVSLRFLVRFRVGGMSVQRTVAPCNVCVSGVEARMVVPVTLTNCKWHSASINGIYNNLIFCGSLQP